MPLTQLPIANGHYLSDSLPISAQECIGWYPNLPQIPALSQETLFGTPGFTEVLRTGDLFFDSNRGSHSFNSRPYFVNGNTLFRVEDNILFGIHNVSLQNLGTIEGSGFLSMAESENELMILVPSGKGYIFTENPDTLTEITDPDFQANGNPLYVVYVDGYFCCTTDASKFIISNINQGLVWTATDFGSAESSPDAVVVPIVYKNQLFIIGSVTGEGFTNIGSTASAGFPFKRSGLFLDKGTITPFSTAITNDTFMYIGGSKDESPAIWAFADNSMTKISTTAIDSILQKFNRQEIIDSFSWTYAQKGAFFIGFSLPTTTIVYEIFTKRWHERKSLVTFPDDTKEFISSRITTVVSAYGLLFVGDSHDGRIGVMSPDIYTEYGEAILRRVVTQPFLNQTEPFFVPSLELTLESGIGNADVPNPVVRMDRSLDGGRTFRDSRQRFIGQKGNYKNRSIWRRNGRVAFSDSYGFTMTDAVKPVIIALHGELTA